MDYLQYIIKMQSIAKIGLKYSTDAYALENYLEIQELSKQALSEYTDNSLSHDNYFVRDVYPTPSISTRVIVEHEGAILFVRERVEQKYSLPGGWCDVFKNVRENAYDEVIQESGFEVEINRVLAIFDRSKYTPIKSSVPEYSIYFCATIIGGNAKVSHETDDVAFYHKDKLPDLSFKNTHAELAIAFDIYYNNKDTYFD